MARRAEDSENWGGKRKGAGRPKTIGEETRQISVRLDVETAEKCKALGGAAFMRRALRDEINRLSGAPEDEKRSEAPSAAWPGFDAVDRSSFARLSAANECRLPLAGMSVSCGFPSPAVDASAEDVSLSELVVHHPGSSFVAEAVGDSMVDAGIFEGDKIILDQGIAPRSGDIVLAWLHGDMTLKRLKIVNNRPELHPENDKAGYPVICPSKEDGFQILGVLTGICRAYR